MTWISANNRTYQLSWTSITIKLAKRFFNQYYTFFIPITTIYYNLPNGSSKYSNIWYMWIHAAKFFRWGE